VSIGLPLEYFFVLIGLFVAAVALRIARNESHPRRWGSTAFWLLLALALGAGKLLSSELVGWMVLMMGLLVGTKQVAVPDFSANSAAREAGASRLQNRLIGPILLVPVLAIVGSFVVGSQVALGIGCLVGLAAALWVTKDSPAAPVQEGGRLLELLGWAIILPQALAGLGGIFAKAHGGNPAIMGALGMLSGYCGTLVTPMAANFNLVPVRLLELKDDWAVIKAQAPFAAAIWIFNVVVMYACVYRF
jgi:uncharacterized membrane protein